MCEIIYGIHAIEALLNNNPKCFINIFILKTRKDMRIKKILYLIKKNQLKFNFVEKNYLHKQIKNTLHQGIIAYINPILKKNIQNNILDILKNIKDPFFLILDRITDPHNLGACIRCADAAGINAIIAPKNNSAKVNSTVKKVACGSTEYVPLIYVTNLIRTINLLKQYNIKIIGTDCYTNKNLYSLKLTGPLAFIIGSENNGLRHLTKLSCHELVRIPMFRNNINSINASVSTGICLFEALRQRKYSL